MANRAASQRSCGSARENSWPRSFDISLAREISVANAGARIAFNKSFAISEGGKAKGSRRSSCVMNAIVWQTDRLYSGSISLSILKKMPFEWLVGLRYTRAGRRSGRNSFISFISLISMAGIALGVAALIIVMSVMNGFQKDVRDKMLSVLAHIEISGTYGTLPEWQLTEQQALKEKEVTGAAPYVTAQAMLTREDEVRG